MAARWLVTTTVSIVSEPCAAAGIAIPSANTDTPPNSMALSFAEALQFTCLFTVPSQIFL
ncbi:hypothetical protein GCM10008942_22230 [Rhizomicrobium electricum]|uniref:Uncharacterized protein n=1 Tax=Rhizomicrobium electricum TaxID=480070 RepID=A0ABP3PWL0_9PROT